MTSFTTTYLYIYRCPANETTVRQNSLTPMPLIFVKNSVIHSAIEKHCYEIEEACRCTTSSDICIHHEEEIIQIIMNGYVYIYIYISRMCVYSTWYVSWHVEAREKWPWFCRRHFQMHFREWKSYFHSNFTWVCSLGSSWQYVSINLGDVLVSQRWQSNISTNNGPVYWHMYASLDLN